MTNDEVNRVIAEWVGGESDEPILVMDDEGYITAQVISDADKHEQIDYCSSLDPTVAAMKGKVSVHLEICDDGYTYAYVYKGNEHKGADDSDYPMGYAHVASSPEALAHALAEAILSTKEEER